MRRYLATSLAIAVLALVACGDESRSDQSRDRGGLDPTPEKLDGTESTEFEADDIERAENASDAVEDYCSGAVSEAQRIGCLSHVDEGEIP